VTRRFFHLAGSQYVKTTSTLKIITIRPNIVQISVHLCDKKPTEVRFREAIIYGTVGAGAASTLFPGIAGADLLDP
jgi:hypothetical protein